MEKDTKSNGLIPPDMQQIANDGKTGNDHRDSPTIIAEPGLQNEIGKTAGLKDQPEEDLLEGQGYSDKSRKELELELLRYKAQFGLAQKELQSLTYSIAHDLRSPLRAINGYAQIFKEDHCAQLDPEAERVMNNIMKGAQKMGHLIDGVLAVSQVIQKELIGADIDMNSMVTNLCEEVKRDQGERKLEIKINELSSAYGDGHAIKQAWENLISNAVKFSKSKESTLIEISSEIKDKEIIYSIKDNGIGFDMKYANKLFGLFQRLHSSEQFEGAGVGLAIVHRIITRHDGRVWADAKVNEGAMFSFSLPLNQA